MGIWDRNKQEALAEERREAAAAAGARARNDIDLDRDDITVRHDDLRSDDLRSDDDLVVRHEETIDLEPLLIVRGGISLWAVVTGTLTALGFMLLAAAIVGGIAAASNDAAPATVIGDYGIWAALAFVFAQFFAYLWGGYTAGRMARGLGALNGLFVPLLSLAIAGIVVAIADALGADAALTVPSVGNVAVPVGDSTITGTGAGVGISALIAMFAGGIYGGILGARWHTRLEDPDARPRGRRVD